MNPDDTNSEDSNGGTADCNQSDAIVKSKMNPEAKDFQSNVTKIVYCTQPDEIASFTVHDTYDEWMRHGDIDTPAFNERATSFSADGNIQFNGFQNQENQGLQNLSADSYNEVNISDGYTTEEILLTQDLKRLIDSEYSIKRLKILDSDKGNPNEKKAVIRLSDQLASKFTEKYETTLQLYNHQLKVRFPTTDELKIIENLGDIDQNDSYDTGSAINPARRIMSSATIDVNYNVNAIYRYSHCTPLSGTVDVNNNINAIPTTGTRKIYSATIDASDANVIPTGACMPFSGIIDPTNNVNIIPTGVCMPFSGIIDDNNYANTIPTGVCMPFSRTIDEINNVNTTHTGICVPFSGIIDQDNNANYFREECFLTPGSCIIPENRIAFDSYCSSNFNSIGCSSTASDIIKTQYVPVTAKIGDHIFKILQDHAITLKKGGNIFKVRFDPVNGVSKLFVPTYNPAYSSRANRVLKPKLNYEYRPSWTNYVYTVYDSAAEEQLVTGLNTILEGYSKIVHATTAEYAERSQNTTEEQEEFAHSAPLLTELRYGDQIKFNFEKPVIGPVGCNLFIYYLPSDFFSVNLIHRFKVYGKIVSANVVLHPTTLHSRCFGFVSFARRVSARCAVQNENGRLIGNKRLKVEVKK